MMTKQIIRKMGLFGLATTLFSTLNIAANPNPAGILFVTKDQRGIVRVLLAREARGRSRGTWSDCGGIARPNETAWETACREAAEETRAYFLPSGIHANALTQANALRRSVQHLRSQRPVGCITQYWRRFGHNYHMYIVPVSFIDANRIMQGAYRHNEKNAYRWVSLWGLLRSIEQGKDYYECKDGTRLQLRPSFMTLFCDRRNGNFRLNSNHQRMQNIMNNCFQTL